MSAKTSSIIVSGFLGSGKTLFIIRSLLPRFKDKRIAILVNDFGEINYDKLRLYQEAIEVQGIEGGCFCCELGGEFLEGLSRFKESELLIVETSGVSDPSPIYYALESSGYKVELLIGVFGLDLPEHLLADPLVKSQIEASQCLVLTKADLFTERELSQRLTPFQKFNKPLFLAKEGLVEEPIECLLSLPLKEPRVSFKQANFQSFTLRLRGYYQKGEVEVFFRLLPKNIYRAKGIIYCLESPVPLSLSYSFGYLFWERLVVLEDPFLVFIGQDFDPKIFNLFPNPTKLSAKHEKTCLPLADFDSRTGLGYLRGEALDELEVAERVLEELEEDHFLFVSGDELNFQGFKDIQKLLEDLNKTLEKEGLAKIVFWKIPSGVVSYLLKNLPQGIKTYHFSRHYLLPKAYASLKIDQESKEKCILGYLTCKPNKQTGREDLNFRGQPLGLSPFLLL